jgi:hypothetical protein
MVLCLKERGSELSEGLVSCLNEFINSYSMVASRDVNRSDQMQNNNVFIISVSVIIFQIRIWIEYSRDIGYGSDIGRI